MAVLALLAAQSGSSSAQESISASNTSRYVGGGRWDWTVFLRASTTVLSQIQCVEYTLHPTFPNPIRRVCDRGKESQPFALSSSGWGVFTIPVRIFFRDGKEQRLEYRLTFAPLAMAAHVPDRAATGLVCDTQINVTIPEGAVRPVKGRSQTISVYAEEIHERRSSHIYIVNTMRDLSQKAGKLPEKDFLQLLRNSGIRPAAGGNLAPETYAAISLGVAEATTLSLPSGKLSLAIANPENHKYVDVRLCLPD